MGTDYELAALTLLHAVKLSSRSNPQDKKNLVRY